MSFLNFSNHSSDNWSETQKKAAIEYGEIIDLAFPMVAPENTSEDIRELTREYVQIITELNPSVVLCQGEFTLTYSVVRALKALGIKVVSACGSRDSHEEYEMSGVTKKLSKFEFVQFREY